MHDPWIVPELYFRQWGAELDPQMWERGCFLERLRILTAIAVARKDKMDYNIATAMDSTIQIALMVTPVTVLVGWIVQSEVGG
jgi:hypothetical protein